MERDTIYLDNDEEITSVVDKLKGTDFGSIDLVIPKEALILQSVVNLKLLKKQAEGLGKEITIVTQDKVGRKLAEQIGIPVVEKPGETPKEPLRVSEAEPVAGVAGAATAVGAVALADTDDEVPIEMKPEASPIEPTKEVIPEQKNIKTEELNNKPIENMTKGAKKRWYKNWKVWLPIAGIVTLALIAAGYIYLPMVNITIKLASEKKKVDFTFTADKSVNTVDVEKQVIPGQEISGELEKSAEYPTTGKKKTGTKATGSVTITDKGYTSKPNSTTVIAGTRFVSPSGLVFKSTANVTVPGFEKVGGVTTPGTANVAVEADQVGEQYNLGATTFSIPAINDSNFTAANAAAFTGGTSKDIQFVTQADVDAAKADISKQLEQELVAEVNKKSDRDQRVVDKAYKVEVLSATATPDVNGEASKFTMKMKSKITAIAFKEDDLSKLAEAILGDEIGSGKEIVEKASLTQAAELVEGDFANGTIKVKVSGEASIAANLDEEKIKTDIAGDPNDVALSKIQEIEGVTGAQITRQFPKFYKRVPRIKSHIYLAEEIVKSE